MKRLMPIFIVILLSGCGILTAYAPNMLSMIVVAVMGVVVLLGIIYGLIPVLTFTQGLLTGQKSIQRASEAEEKSVWITALQMDRFFRQKKMDQLFREYRDKVKQQVPLSAFLGVLEILTSLRLRRHLAVCSPF